MRQLGHRGRGRYRNRGRISVGFIDTDTDSDSDADGPISKMRIAGFLSIISGAAGTPPPYLMRGAFPLADGVAKVSGD